MVGEEAAYQATFKNTYLSTRILLGREVAIILCSDPHSAGDFAAEIISCYSSQTLWRIL